MTQDQAFEAGTTPCSLRLDELLDYSDHERRKWRAWFTADRGRLDIPFQPGGRFPTAGALLDHLFLVERRHLSRLEGAAPPDTTGVAAGDIETLFEFADLVRASLRRFVSELSEARAAETLSFAALSGTFTMTRRKLTAHILIHEIRHFAQLAYAARLAGHEPPGEHDLAFCQDLA